MRYLICLIQENDGHRFESIEVTPENERKITHLTRAKILPPSILLNTHRIEVDTILGFCDKPLGADLSQSESRQATSWKVISDRVRQQEWYLRATQGKTRKPGVRLRKSDEAPSASLF